jgi:hypothetical protein
MFIGTSAGLRQTDASVFYDGDLIMVSAKCNSNRIQQSHLCSFCRVNNRQKKITSVISGGHIRRGNFRQPKTGHFIKTKHNLELAFCFCIRFWKGRSNEQMPI